MIEGVYMGKKRDTYREYLPSIRSFYLAPCIGLALTAIIPSIYLLCQIYVEDLKMFSKENLKWIITVLVVINIEVNAMVLMILQANKLREKIQ